MGVIMNDVIQLYTSEYTHPQSQVKMLNLIHVHLNDMSSEVSFDVKHMTPGLVTKTQV